MYCPHCNENAGVFFNKKKEVLICKKCNKKFYVVHENIYEQNPIAYTFASILFIGSFSVSFPLNVFMILISIVIAISSVLNEKPKVFKTEKELNTILYPEKNIDTSLNDYPEALEYHKNDDAFKLAIFYEENLKDYKEAILWYEKAYIQGNTDSLNIIGLIYKNKLNDNQKAKEYFIKSIKIGNIDSIQNIALFYYTIEKDNITASAYYIALLDIKYSKELV